MLDIVSNEINAFEKELKDKQKEESKRLEVKMEKLTSDVDVKASKAIGEVNAITRDKLLE